MSSTTVSEQKTGETSNMCVDKLICRIERLLVEKDILSKFIKRPRTLISALEQLKELIEMKDMKENLVEWIYVLLLDEYQFSKSEYKNGRVLHFCNYGNPGTGKTQVSKIIAKIFYAIGFSDKNKPVPKENSPPLEFRTLKQYLSNTNKNLSKLKDLYPKKRLSKSPVINHKPDGEDIAWKELETSLMAAIQITDKFNKTSSTYEPEEENIDDDPNVKESVYCVVCGRNELVAKFMGQTSGLAYDFLMANRGKTIIIEEAYSLWGGEKDIYGAEAMVEINRFMEEKCHNTPIAFNGYRDLLASSIFKVQPGLESRIEQFFSMSGYSAEGLVKILIKQAYSIGIVIPESINVIEFFQNNMKYFTSYGRDTFHLARIIRRKCAYIFIEKTIAEDSEFIVNQEVFDIATRAYVASSFNK